MRPFQKAAILGSLIVVLVSYPAAQETVAEVVKRSSDAVVLIVISNSSGQETALGSGFLISADGEIVTNYHVIREAHSAIVRLSNGAFFPVNGVLASDADKDLAIIKVGGKNLPFLTLGDIDKVHIGDHVVAIGSPLGLEGTVSDGVVSAIRDVESKKWIQTTAPVSHGNSGGPLLDLNNNVVGVITWGVQEGQNLNFAATCSEVKALLAKTPEQAKPLDSVAGKGEVGFAGGTVWTSLVSGQDYTIRHDGDYLYIEWINIPPATQERGGFMRVELKKSPDGKWRGKVHSLRPCQYLNVVNSCLLEGDYEIDLLSDNRIEGIGPYFKYTCKKCEVKKVERMPFTLIPK
jgi:V8-like Glu-specific endopeptidase